VAIINKLAQAPDYAIDKIHRTPSTNLRQIATMIVFLSTAAKYLIVSSWVPSGEWLSFIVVMAGVDVAQFGIKRKTNDPNLSNGTNA
jgi:hypothetical protein